MTFEEFIHSVWPEGFDVDLPDQLKDKARAYIYWSLSYLYDGKTLLESELPWKNGGLVYQIAFEPQVGLSGAPLTQKLIEKLTIVAGSPSSIFYDLPEPLYVLPIPEWSTMPIGSGNSRIHTPIWLQFKKEAEQIARPYMSDLLNLFS